MRHYVVIGLGSIGRRHLTNLARRDPSARFTVVRHCGGDDELCQKVGARVVTEVRELANEQVDLVVLSTPSANHVDTLPWLIERGWALLVEKPIVTELAQCDQIDRLLDAAPSAVRAAGFNLRHLPSIRRIKKAIDDGDVGVVVRATLIAGQWLPDWRPNVDYRTVYSSDARRGGGVELDLSHEFDLARWFFGELDVDFAAGGKFSDLELDANDTAVSVLSPRHGRNPIVTVSLDYVSRRRVRWYEVVGDRARVEWNLDGSLGITTADGAISMSTSPDDFDVAATYVGLLDGVVHAIDTGDRRHMQTLEDGLLSTRLALQVRDRGGRP